MASTYTHIIFDLDDTVWDYQQNSSDTLFELWQHFKLADHAIPFGQFHATFRQVNNALWDSFDQGKITRDIIRAERFPRVFKALKLNLNGAALTMQEMFMTMCSSKPALVQGVRQVLETFHQAYQFHILSNGFDEIQFAKLEAANIGHFFTHVVTSGSTGFRKPEPQIFDFMLTKINALPQDCLMIGDNPISDIQGARQAGIDQVYYNVHQKNCPISPTFTITHMRELHQIL